MCGTLWKHTFYILSYKEQIEPITAQVSNDWSFNLELEISPYQIYVTQGFQNITAFISILEYRDNNLVVKDGWIKIANVSKLFK